MAENDGTPLPIIVRVGEEEATLEGPPPDTMLELEEKTRHALGYGAGAKFCFKWIDEEEDMIMLGSDEELKESLSSVSKSQRKLVFVGEISGDTSKVAPHAPPVQEDLDADHAVEYDGEVEGWILLKKRQDKESMSMASSVISSVSEQERQAEKESQEVAAAEEKFQQLEQDQKLAARLADEMEQAEKAQLQEQENVMLPSAATMKMLTRIMDDAHRWQERWKNSCASRTNKEKGNRVRKRRMSRRRGRPHASSRPPSKTKMTSGIPSTRKLGRKFCNSLRWDSVKTTRCSSKCWRIITYHRSTLL
uniref:PB1 domain-containing protein n=1 Tax=Guillardia theta TaxID=55529 RepID=A0A7S4KRZ9_GUITH